MIFVPYSLLLDFNTNIPIGHYSIAFVFLWFGCFFYGRIEAVVTHSLLALSTRKTSIESILMRAVVTLQTVKSIEELNDSVDETLRQLFGFTKIELFYTEALLLSAGERLPDIYQKSQVSAKIKLTKANAFCTSTVIFTKNCPDKSLRQYLLSSGVSVVFVLYHNQDIVCVIEAYGQPSL